MARDGQVAVLPSVERHCAESCERLRDRFLFTVLHDSGCRIGEALGLRHEDIAPAERDISIVRRANDNGARSKSTASWTLPVSGELLRLYADYLHGEYGDLGSDYVFVNRHRLRPALVAAQRGHPDAARRRPDRGGLQTVGPCPGHSPT